MADIEHASVLLRLEKVDIDALDATAGIPQIGDSIFGFHAQQAIAKLLKAWLAASGILYSKTHQIARLRAVSPCLLLFDPHGRGADREQFGLAPVASAP